MKKITILSSLVALVLLFAACGGPESDAKKMIKKIEKYTEVANDAANDEKLDSDEIEELNDITKDIEELVKKYEDDKEGKEKIDQYFKDNEEEIEKTIEEFEDAFMDLYGCEDFDKLEEFDFSLDFGDEQKGPEADAKKMIKIMENLTKVANKAATDSKLDDKEIKEIKKFLKDMEEIEERYTNDPAASEKIEKYFVDHEEEINKVYEEFMNALMSLYSCEGAENLE